MTTQPAPLTPEELDQIEDETDSWRGRAGIVVDLLIATIRAAWSLIAQYELVMDPPDIVQKEVNRKTLADAHRAGREQGLEEAAEVTESLDDDTLHGGTILCTMTLRYTASSIRALKKDTKQ